MTRLELLAPAKNMELGIAAINHGADAVYIGADRFGARSAAGNSVKDISKLCDHAHFYRAKVYVAFNTILFDHEMEPARKLIFKLWDAGIDALIIQDMGLMELELPPVPLFASTQTDNQTPEKVKFLEQTGFERVILARELDLKTIAKIRAATNVDLEAFIHGALCTCYSGQCYMSAAIGGRSANRGACGQPCRLPWNLVNEKGKILAKDRYLLSLKDMDRSKFLSDMAAADVTSFKIEGRLKDLSYVKNITGYYRKKLDALLESNPDYTKASSGKIFLSFEPNPEKTFNRGTSDYYLNKQGPDHTHSLDTPKSIGQAVGNINHIGSDWFSLSGYQQINNGDGLCFFNQKGQLRGFRINRVGSDNRLYLSGKNPVKSLELSIGLAIFRNHDQAFSKLLNSESAQRKLGLELVLTENHKGILLSGKDEDGIEVKIYLNMEKEAAKKPNQAIYTIEKQLGKLGTTPFFLNKFIYESRPLFLPVKILNQLRRELIAELNRKRKTNYSRRKRLPLTDTVPYPFESIDFKLNIANKAAEKFYIKRGVKQIEPAFETQRPEKAVTIMTTRHCIRYSIGVCTQKKQVKATDLESPLFIENDRGCFKIIFDCKNCRMMIMNNSTRPDNLCGAIWKVHIRKQLSILIVIC